MLFLNPLPEDGATCYRIQRVFLFCLHLRYPFISMKYYLFFAILAFIATAFALVIIDIFFDFTLLVSLLFVFLLCSGGYGGFTALKHYLTERKKK